MQAKYAAGAYANNYLQRKQRKVATSAAGDSRPSGSAGQLELKWRDQQTRWFWHRSTRSARLGGILRLVFFKDVFLKFRKKIGFYFLALRTFEAESSDSFSGKTFFHFKMKFCIYIFIIRLQRHLLLVTTVWHLHLFRSIVICTWHFMISIEQKLWPNMRWNSDSCY